MKKTLKILLLIISTLLLVFALLMLYASLMDYKPAESDVLFESEDPTMINKDTLQILSWNIGYAGLDAGMDFFYDGGEKVRTPKEDFEENLSVITSVIQVFGKADFIMLQEVDQYSKRSFYVDEVALIGEANPQHFYSLAINYDVKFVPLPITSPMGRVLAGLFTMSRSVPSIAKRISLPGNYPWPTRIFMLDRCLLLQRYPTKGNELVLINLHNSAFDADGTLRKQQVDKLKEILMEEYSKGHYVICGGDWNQNPPGFDLRDLHWDDNAKTIDPPVQDDFLPSGWTWAWPSNAPTQRNLDKAYSKGETATSVIDFFLLSPNIDCLDVETINMDFAHSDHQPVVVRVVLK